MAKGKNVRMGKKVGGRGGRPHPVAGQQQVDKDCSVCSTFDCTVCSGTTFAFVCLKPSTTCRCRCRHRRPSFFLRSTHALDQLRPRPYTMPLSDLSGALYAPMRLCWYAPSNWLVFTHTKSQQSLWIATTSSLQLRATQTSRATNKHACDNADITAFFKYMLAFEYSNKTIFNMIQQQLFTIHVYTKTDRHYFFTRYHCFSLIATKLQLNCK